MARNDCGLRILNFRLCPQEQQEAVQNGRADRRGTGHGKDAGLQLRVVESASDNLEHVPKTRAQARIEGTGREGHSAAVHVLEQ